MASFAAPGHLQPPRPAVETHPDAESLRQTTGAAHAEIAGAAPAQSRRREHAVERRQLGKPQVEARGEQRVHLVEERGAVAEVPRRVGPARGARLGPERRAGGKRRGIAACRRRTHHSARVDLRRPFRLSPRPRAQDLRRCYRLSNGAQARGQGDQRDSSTRHNCFAVSVSRVAGARGR